MDSVDRNNQINFKEFHKINVWLHSWNKQSMKITAHKLRILQRITRLYTECKIKIYKNSTAILTWTYLEMMQCKYIITDSRLLLGKTVYITQNEMIWTILIYITSLYTQSGVKMCYKKDQRWCIKSILLILNSCSNSIMKTPIGSKYW